MVALSLFQKITGNETILLFDIGSATVGVAVVRYQRDGNIETLFTHREPIALDTATNAEELGAAVGTAIVNANNAALGNVQVAQYLDSDYSVHALVHSPWSDSRSERAESRFKSATRVTKDIVQQFIHKHFPSETIPGRHTFGTHVIRVELNGYNTTNPYDKDAQTIAVTLLKNTMANEVHAAIQDAFARAVPNHDVEINAFLYAALQIPELFKATDAYTVVDISGEYTSVHVIRDGTVTGSVQLSFGTESLIRAMSTDIEGTRNATITELTMYLNNACTPSQCRRAEQALKKVEEEEWVPAFMQACQKMSEYTRMPTKTFLLVDERYHKWFEEALQQANFGACTVTSQAPQVASIDVHSTKRALTFGKDIEEDTMLAVGALFVDK